MTVLSFWRALVGIWCVCWSFFYVAICVLQLAEDNAKKATENGIFFDDDRQEKRKERCNKPGGGAQSRATKTKSTMENLRGKAAANKDGGEEQDNFEDGNVKK